MITFPLKPGVHWQVKRGLAIVYDSQLGHHRLDPYPDPQAVSDYYEDDQFYSTHSPPDWFEKEKDEYQSGLWHSYFKYLARLGGQARTVLDYGCGCGWFVDYYQWSQKAPIVAGLELSESAISAGESALGALPVERNFDNLPVQVYDLIYFNLVLEHIPYPVNFLTNLVGNRLESGGRVVVVVPNDMNSLQWRLGYSGFVSPVHVNYFTPDTLRSVMARAGLTIVHEAVTFPMELFPLAGINYFGNDDLGRQCHRLRLKWEKLLGWRVFGLYKTLYDLWGIGRELIFVGEKR